jgi:hypothetical protein
MNIIDRAKNILVSPAAEWRVVDGESTPTGAILTGYVLPLAAVSAVAALIGQVVIGFGLGGYRVPVTTAVMIAVWSIATAVIGCFLIGLIISALGPTFGAQKSDIQGLKVAAYSFTPVWVAGMFRIIPLLGILGLIGAIYAVYLLYLGLQIVMKSPQDKAVGYTLAVVVLAFVAMFILTAIFGLFVGGMYVAGVR